MPPRRRKFSTDSSGHSEKHDPLRPPVSRLLRHHTTKRNFEIFKAPDFIAAALLHLPPKGQQTVRYYGRYSNKFRGQTSPIPDRIIQPPQPEIPPEKPPPAQILLIPAPPKQSARDMRPLWRDLILKVWGGDPLKCPCYKGTMKPVRTFLPLSDSFNDALRRSTSKASPSNS